MENMLSVWRNKTLREHFASVCAKRSQNEGESDWDFLVRWRKWNKNTIYEMEDEIETHKTEMKESPQS